MTDQDFHAFRRLLEGAASVFNETLTADRALLYFGALKDLPVDTIERGVLTAVQRSRFFPKPVEIRDYAIGDPETLALLAWERLWQAIRCVGPDTPITFDDPATHAAIEKCGGWRNVTMWYHTELEQRGYRKLEFMRLWRHYQANPQEAKAPAILNDLGIGNRLRRIDANGLPEVIMPRALNAAPEAGPEIDVTQEWPKLVADLAARQPPPPARKGPRLHLREDDAIAMLGTGERSAEDRAALEAKRQEELRRFREQYGEGAA